MKIATAITMEQYEAMWQLLAESYAASGPGSERFRGQVSLVATIFPLWSEEDIEREARRLSESEEPEGG